MTYEEFLEQDFDWTINSIDHQFYSLTIQEAIEKAKEYLLIGKRVTDPNIRRYAEEHLEIEEEKPKAAPVVSTSLPPNKTILKRHQGKGFKKYFYDLPMISSLTGRSITVIRQDIYRKKLDLHNIISVAEYLKKYTVVI